ncbi:hypothetical protein MVEN_01342600 [Mycena venus]|uniref:Uncharacterized protein n=1 Tax=Mycena venus TaxID=2733690 RepID=A0A8H6XZB1_9AGAR|nr:hypothetical protein MVEN_01342600 [Mycena venus]
MPAAPAPIPGDLPHALIGIVSLWATTFIYGLNVVMFIICFAILVKRKGQRTPWYLLAGIWIQFSLATAHAILSFSAGIHAFNTVTSTPALLISTWISPLGTYTAIQQIVYAINNFFGDLILIWRLYVVYGDNWYITIFPIVLALAAEACNLYGAVNTFANPSIILRAGNHKAASTLTNMVTAGFSMTAAIQLLVTTLLAVKIYIATLSIGKFTTSSQRYTGVMWMLVESGAAMATMEIIFLGVWRNGLSGLAQLSLAILGQLCVLVPLSIIARVGLRLDSNSTSQTAGASGASKATGSLPPIRFARGPGHSTTIDDEGTLNLSEYKAGTWSKESEGNDRV